MKKFLALLGVSSVLLFSSVWSAPSIPGPIRPGDADGDGRVTMRDAQIALQIVVGKIKPNARMLIALDLAPKGAPDGRITIGDVILIQRLALGLK